MPRREPDGSVLWHGFVQDVTDREQAEKVAQAASATLQAALASMNDAVFISDLEGRFLDFNDAFASFHRFRSKEECARTLAEYPAFLEVFLPDGTLAPLEQWAVSRALRGETASSVEYTLHRKDTGETWVGSYSFAPIRDEHAAIIGSVVTGRDITEHKRIEGEVRRLNEELEQRVQDRTGQLEAANKELEAFAYSVSHDLRAPLRGIDGWSLALVEDYGERLEGEARQYLHRIRADAQRMGRLIDAMLQLARVARTPITPRPVDLSALAETIVGRLRAAYPDRLVETVIEPGVIGHGDATLLEVAMSNLLDNAWKFCASRRPAHVAFGATRLDGEQVFFVRDDGVAFDMAYAEKLFGVFQRLHRTSEFPGTGVGLAIVQRIVHRHGGRVWAEAEVDHGATFSFTLEEGA